jgi:p-aminobenzoyl-glutamate transporter AbgT
MKSFALAVLVPVLVVAGGVPSFVQPVPRVGDADGEAHVGWPP